MFGNPGILFALLAFTSWGLLPLFWKSLAGVPAFDILCHRMVWSAVTIGIVLLCCGKMKGTIQAVRSPRTLALFGLTGLLIGSNWLTYIWAVNNNYVLESSLGYFITPLVNIALGRLFLKERLRLLQQVAVLLAVIGVALLTFGYGKFPWVAITLALTFSSYGLLRKIATAGSLEGLFVETILLATPALLYLLTVDTGLPGDVAALSPQVSILLLLAGPVTVLPLYWYTRGARLISLTTLGIMQYCAPTLQFLLAVFVFGEPFSSEQLSAFLFIWTGLALFSLESMYRYRQSYLSTRLKAAL